MDPHALMEQERITREKQNRILKVLVPIIVAFIAFCFTFCYTESCERICPSHMKKPTGNWRNAEVDLDTLFAPCRWMYKYLYLYRPFCRLCCPFRSGYRESEIINKKKTASSSNNNDAATMSSQQLANLLDNLADADKTVWFSNGVSVYEPVFLEHGWQIATNVESARVVYFVRRKHARKLYRRFLREERRRAANDDDDDDDAEERTGRSLLFQNQAVNYIRGTYIITEKYKLQQSLRTYARESGNKRALHLQPSTYLLNDPKECTDFFNNKDNYRNTPPDNEKQQSSKSDKKQNGDDKNNKNKNNNVWLIKASALSRGEGITIYDDLNKAKAEYIDPDTGKCRALPQTTEDEVVAQRYLMNPLLLDGKKMELRTYWLIASVDPFIALYHDGTVRRATSDWKPDKWDDPLMHICNTFQQKKADPQYYEKQDDRKWTVPQLEAYLLETKKVAAAGWWNATLKRQLKRMLAIVVKASIAAGLKEAVSPPFAFSLMGMDSMLDSDLRPWLTEVQTGPGLSMDDATKKKLIGPMVTEAMNIVLEVHYRKQRGLSLATLESVNQFEWVYNEVSGFDAEVS